MIHLNLIRNFFLCIFHLGRCPTVKAHNASLNLPAVELIDSKSGFFPYCMNNDLIFDNHLVFTTRSGWWDIFIRRIQEIHFPNPWLKHCKSIVATVFFPILDIFHHYKSNISLKYNYKKKAKNFTSAKAFTEIINRNAILKKCP